MELLVDPQAWIALVTLTALEIVLGIDNIVFISILVGHLPERHRDRARFIGLALAMATRIALLLSLTWIMSLTTPLFAALDREVSARDLILVGGGLFLLWKSVHEIHGSLEGDEQNNAPIVKGSFSALIVQIAVVDIIFSLDSVITAVGMVDQIEIMIAAIVIAVLVMMTAAKTIGNFIENHPTIQMLALSFLILVGMTLIAEGFGFHVPKGYIYFAMAFSIAVEMLNLRIRKHSSTPLRLRRKKRHRNSS